MSSRFRLDGRVALITGASQGLGWVAAEALAEQGAEVVLNARNAAALEERANALRAAGHQASFIAFDATEPRACRDAVARIEDEQGRLDILINNAGTIHRAPTPEWSDEDWSRVVDLNLTACFTLAREAVRGMAARGWGRIINTGSVFSAIARPEIPAYVASKHGLHGLSKALAVEFAARGVTANTIAPGFFATEFTAPRQADPEFDAMVKGRTPAGRWGIPHELGGTIVFLASEEAAYINGIMLPIDGGMTAAF